MSTAPVSAADVAAALRERLPAVGTKKLHKLLYYCQGHHLAMSGSPIFSESVGAWDMGPVVGSLWKSEQGNGPARMTHELDESQLNTVGYVVSRYGRLTGRDLENLTHAESPWLRADECRAPGTSARIEQSWLMEYFASEPAEDEGGGLLLDSDEVNTWLADAQSRRYDDLREDSVEILRARLIDAS